MSTIVIAFIIVVLAVIGIGIGYFITGKCRASCGPCGKSECCKKSDTDNKKGSSCSKSNKNGCN
ncbi:MAG: hypothetical protein HY860_02595 [Chlamydiales bacterium]|nr:hypothetical protein [Chlamydiales bacterium]